MQQVNFLIINTVASELRAILRKLPNIEPVAPTAGEPHKYYRADLPVTTLNRSETSYSIIVAHPLTMGIGSASSFVYDAIQRWNPDNVFLVGVAGGISQKVSLGDILISDEIVGYSFPRAPKDTTEFDVFRSPVSLLAPVSNYKNDTWKDLLEFPELKERKLQVHFGPVASGNVIPDPEFIQALHKHRQDIVGIEMEGLGIVETVLRMHEHKPGFLLIRSVADLADSQKVDDWQKYACDIAASYAIGLIKSGLLPSSTKVESSPIIITIPGDVKEFSIEQQKQLVETLSKTLGISRNDIKIINVIPGSLKIVIEFTENTAQETAWLLVSKLLRETSDLKPLGIQKVELGLQSKSVAQHDIHPNICLLEKRMDDALQRDDFAGVLHASANIFETMAKDVVGIPTVQNQTLKSFFDRYRKDSGLPAAILDYIIAIYDARSSTPLAGHGSTQLPGLTKEMAIVLREMTAAFVKIEYALRAELQSKP